MEVHLVREITQWLDELRQHWQHAVGSFYAITGVINGSYVTILIWVVGGLLGLASALFGMLLKAHKERDDERLQEVKDEAEAEATRDAQKFQELRSEIERIRARLHEYAPAIGWVDQQRRWEDQDRRKDE